MQAFEGHANGAVPVKHVLLEPVGTLPPVVAGQKTITSEDAGWTNEVN